MLTYHTKLKPLARNLRSNMTDAEQMLWFRLRRKQVMNLQFYRQKPLAGYIADFYCAAARLVIELDGSQHHDATALQRDQQRTAALQKLGLRVIRFDNRQVLLELEAVMDVIVAVVAEEIPPSPPLAKGGDQASGTAPCTRPAQNSAPCSQTGAEPNSPLCKRGARGDLPLASIPEIGKTP